MTRGNQGGIIVYPLLVKLLLMLPGRTLAQFYMVKE